MKSQVKWFSKEKGYGFITDEQNRDLYFGVQDIIGPDLPEHGDIVEYETHIGREEKICANEIKILKKRFPEFKKIHCQSCDMKVEPKLWHYGGSDFTNIQTQYLCPHCGHPLFKTGGGFNLYAKTILVVFTIFISAIVYFTWFH